MTRSVTTHACTGFTDVHHVAAARNEMPETIVVFVFFFPGQHTAMHATT